MSAAQTLREMLFDIYTETILYLFTLIVHKHEIKELFRFILADRNPFVKRNIGSMGTSDIDRRRRYGGKQLPSVRRLESGQQLRTTTPMVLPGRRSDINE